jgi:hypothetical protein
MERAVFKLAVLIRERPRQPGQRPPSTPEVPSDGTREIVYIWHEMIHLPGVQHMCGIREAFSMQDNLFSLQSGLPGCIPGCTYRTRIED